MAGKDIRQPSAEELESARQYLKMTPRPARRVHTEKLRRGLQTLPQELYDRIYLETFTAKPGFRTLGTVDKALKHPFPLKAPKRLGIDTVSRELFAPSYYENTVFVVYEPESCIRWLKSLPAHHRLLLQDVRCVFHRQPPGNGGELEDRNAMWNRMKTIEVRRLCVASGIEQSVADKIISGYEYAITRDLAGFELAKIRAWKMGYRNY